MENGVWLKKCCPSDQGIKCKEPWTNQSSLRYSKNAIVAHFLTAKKIVHQDLETYLRYL